MTLAHALLGRERKLRRLISYWGLTAALYGWCAALLLLEVAAGHAAALPTQLLIAGAAGGLALSYLLTRFGYELGVRPSMLAKLQGCQLLIATAAAYVIVPPVRAAMLSLPIVALLFCAFTMTRKETACMAAAAMALFAGTMLWAASTRPEVFPPVHEFFHFAVLASLLTATTYLTGEYNKLRSRLRSQRMEMQHALGQISLLATVDELTNLPNRRRMKEIIAHENERCVGAGRELCLILLDIDFFKNINDSFGHTIGDEVLRAFASQASDALRATDVMARWGGEEFLLLLADTDRDAAELVLQRLRAEVRVLVVDALPHALTVTFSAGIAWLTPDTTINDAIAQADRAMYRAKLEGRNTSRVFHPQLDAASPKLDPVKVAEIMWTSFNGPIEPQHAADDDALVFEDSTCFEDADSARGVDLSGLKIMVVDDDDLQREVLLMLLDELHAKEPLYASDGRSALAVLADPANSVDVILTDLNMAGMDGIEFMRQLGESGALVSVVLVSAIDATVMKGVEKVADAYGIALLGVLHKPVLKTQLVKVLGCFTSLSRATAKVAGEAETYPARELELALLNREFEPFFHAKVNLQTGRIEGFEALARWRRPGSGIVGPGAFIGVMEESMLIDALTFAILEESSAACNQWRKQGFDYCVSVNVSVKTLSRPDCAQRLLRIVKEEGLPAGCMTIEVTESSTDARELKTVLANLSRLRINGFGLSIDDYGTGYSSMERLSRIAFTELKIDQSFVSGAHNNVSAMAIMQSSVSVAKVLNLVSVAEGVETKEHWELVRDSGCELAQGYYISQPVDAAAVPAMARSWLERIQSGQVQTMDVLIGD